MEIATKQRISYGKAKILQENKEKSYANITRRSNDNQLPRQNDSDDIFRQILKQQNDKMVKQITNLQKNENTHNYHQDNMFKFQYRHHHDRK